MERMDSKLKVAMLAYLKEHHHGIWRQWFDQVEPVQMDGGTLKLLVHEPVQLKYLQKNCVSQFTEAVQTVTGNLLAVRFVGEDDLAPANGSRARSNSTGAPDRGFPMLSEEDDMVLSPDYSFENFIVGPDNRLAHAAAIAVAQKPGRAYNPFFINSGVGLGKTHLLQAICQTAIRNNPHLRIYYVSCNGFMTQFLDAVQAGEMKEFRHKFRHVDMLVVDDIHDLAKRERTQEEFFHTFNTLYQTNRQIVLSSDAPPNEIPDLEERLTSRFNCGLVAKIERPCYETRVEIVKSKSKLRNLEMPDDVAAYVAAKIDTNIRELEGAITQMQNMAVVEKLPVNLELAKKSVGDHTPAGGPQSPTIQVIIEAITRFYDVKLTDLLSKRRHKSIALPRQIGMYLAREHTRYSLEEIGGYFGGRDHTTVMHAVRTIREKQECDATLKLDVERLEQQVLGHQGQPGGSTKGPGETGGGNGPMGTNDPSGSATDMAAVR